VKKSNNFWNCYIK